MVKVLSRKFSNDSKPTITARGISRGIEFEIKFFHTVSNNELYPFGFMLMLPSGRKLTDFSDVEALLGYRDAEIVVNNSSSNNPQFEEWCKSEGII